MYEVFWNDSKSLETNDFATSFIRSFFEKIAKIFLDS